MEQTKQKLIQILLIVNLGISTCAAIGVGYVAYKQSKSPDFSDMGSRGRDKMFPGNGNGQFQPGQEQSGQTQQWEGE
ncbi:hypothetical protein CU072_00670 [Bacillus thuringiensis]|uniref:hypothetical protein n=1 Tax=Bacillus cereus group TaxID=86661 RepID=UPI0008FE13F5|nr:MULTISPECIES: hypothetical protein [Bacillus cereus group]OJE38491.1 hypothetical protein BAQ47_15900 [Bacillus tropicus]PWN17461.1 hypothetical protein CU072_00670 [Bacillus thuringiensis]HDR7797843.1 hypothetical protein [Bacillus tropicus]